MTFESGFVWFLPVYVSMKINDTTTNGTTLNGCTESDLRRAMKNHFTFSYSSFGSDSEMFEEGISIGDWRKNYLKLRGESDFSYYDDYGGFTYDAIWVYIKAIQKLIVGEFI